MADIDLDTSSRTASAPVRPFKTRWRLGLDIGGAIGLALVVLILTVSALAPWITPYDPYQLNMSQSLRPPSLTSGHLLGTDQLGRDMLTRAIYGGRIPIMLVTLAIAVSFSVGVLLGIASALRGGLFDEIVGRVAEIKMSFPTMLLALLFLAFAGVNNFNLFVIVAITMWTAPYRLARAQALTLRNLLFVESARMLGASSFAVLWRHILPNIMPVLVVTGSNSLMGGIGIFSTLSYMGLGVQPPEADWGQMIASGQSQIMAAWWLALVPTAALLLFLVGIQLTTDWLAERLSVPALNRLYGER